MSGAHGGGPRRDGHNDDPEITQALQALDDLPDADLPAHVQAYEQAYRLLQDRLTQAES